MKGVTPFHLPKNNPNALSPRQAEVLDYIISYVESHGFQPTYRDMCKAFGIRSINGVVCHLKSLEKKGRIRIRPGAWGLELLGVRFTRVYPGTDEEETE